MKRALGFLLMLSTASVWAESSPRSMIQIGSSGFGASGSYEKFSPTGESNKRRNRSGSRLYGIFL